MTALAICIGGGLLLAGLLVILYASLVQGKRHEERTDTPCPK